MVEMQGNCPHCGAELEAGAMFCAECGRPVARGGDVPAGQPSAAGAADPAKPQTLERTMIGVQAGSLFGNRSPGTPPGVKAVAPQGAFSPPAAGARPIGRPPSSFGTSFPFNPREDTRSGPPPAANKPAANGGGASPDGSGKPRAEALSVASATSADAAPAGGDGPPAPVASRDEGGAAARDTGKPNVAVKQAARVSAADGDASAVDEDERSATRPRVAPTRQGLSFAGPPGAAPEAAKADAPPSAPPEGSEPSPPTAAAAEERPEPPLNPAPGAGAALGGKTLLDFGRDSGNVGAQLAAAVNAAKASGPSPAQPASPPLVFKPEPAPPAAPPPASAEASAPAQGPMAGSAAEAHAAERPRRPLARTMLGISPEAALGLARGAEADPLAPAASGEPQPPPQAPQPTAPPGRAQNPLARTMLGMAGPVAPLPPVGGAANQTIQGLPVSPAEPVPPPPDRGGMNRTMLGMAPLTNASAVPATPAAPQGFGVPVGGRTMLGVPHTDGAPSAAPPFEARVPPPPPRATVIDTTPPPRREIKALWPLIAATLAVVIATLVLLLRSPQSAGVDVSAKIISTETGEALLFEVPSAAEGSKIRFGGQEKPLTAGRASFALAADSLRVGDNLVLAEVVQPNAEIAPVRITLAVYYRIWVDTAPLRAEKSALDVVVTALPGTKVTLDGEELKLDEAGRGVRSYPIDVVNEAKSGVIEHVVRYRVQPPAGDTVVDELRTRIPVAMMQIDRPGREVITDKESIEIAGAVGKDTQIRLDKTAIPVKDGRFLYRFMLPEPGEYKPKLVASATGRAPLGVTLSIRRVRDLNQAAAQFSPVPDLNYAKLAPNPAIYKGQKIALEGRVYAVDPRGADSVIQMFARPCPSSRRCPLWVSNPQATDVNVDAWIKVLGVVQGEQQFRSEKNEIVTVPKVEAQFVLPASP